MVFMNMYKNRNIRRMVVDTVPNKAVVVSRVSVANRVANRGTITVANRVTNTSKVTGKPVVIMVDKTITERFGECC